MQLSGEDPDDPGLIVYQTHPQSTFKQTQVFYILCNISSLTLAHSVSTGASTRVVYCGAD